MNRAIPRLLIADDHEISAAGTVHLLWEEWPDIVVATGIDQAIRMLDTRPMDLVLLDVMFRHERDRSGFTILRHCARHHPSTRVLLLTGFDDPSTAIAARDQGAHGCVGKHSGLGVLRDAVRTILAGGEWWGELLDAPSLTPRQLVVLGLAARGLTQRQIAEQAGIAEVTVEVHLREVRTRLGAVNTTEAVYLAERLGVLVPDARPGPIAESAPDDRTKAPAHRGGDTDPTR